MQNAQALTLRDVLKDSDLFNTDPTGFEPVTDRLEVGDSCACIPLS
jgi:hypothetical protein